MISSTLLSLPYILFSTRVNSSLAQHNDLDSSSVTSQLVSSQGVEYLDTFIEEE